MIHFLRVAMVLCSLGAGFYGSQRVKQREKALKRFRVLFVRMHSRMILHAPLNDALLYASGEGFSKKRGDIQDKGSCDKVFYSTAQLLKQDYIMHPLSAFKEALEIALSYGLPLLPGDQEALIESMEFMQYAISGQDAKALDKAIDVIDKRVALAEEETKKNAYLFRAAGIIGAALIIFISI